MLIVFFLYFRRFKGFFCLHIWVKSKMIPLPPAKISEGQVKRALQKMKIRQCCYLKTLLNIVNKLLSNLKHKYELYSLVDFYHILIFN